MTIHEMRRHPKAAPLFNTRPNGYYIYEVVLYTYRSTDWDAIAYAASRYGIRVTRVCDIHLTCMIHTIWTYNMSHSHAP